MVKFKFIEEGTGNPWSCFMDFGALSNFNDLIGHFRKTHQVVVPMLPLLDLDLLHTSVGGLQKFVHKFIEQRNYTGIHLMGNSLGGHVALVHILKHPGRIKSLILTGSSGLLKTGWAIHIPKGATKEYIRQRLRSPSTIPRWLQTNWSMKFSRSPITAWKWSRSSPCQNAIPQ